MSKRRFSLKNNLFPFTEKEPILNNFSLYDNFPIGLMILSKVKQIICSNEERKNSSKNINKEMEIKVKYINQQASELFDIKDSDSDSKIHEQIKLFKKFEKNQTTEETLDSIIFDETKRKEYYGSFKNHCSLIYVKYRINNDKIFICSDYYNDERKIMQNQLFQGLKFQYIATLFHELYNPINSLLYMININQNEDENTKNEEKINKKDSYLSSSDEDSNESNSSCIFDDKNNYSSDNESNKLYIKKITRMNILYKEKLKSLEEKEKDINVLINMIYIFLENLMLYFKISLGVDLEDKKQEDFSFNKEVNNTKNDINNNSESIIITESINNSKIYDFHKENNPNNLNKNKKINLEFSFNKIIKKLSYLFKFKCITYPKEFSFLSNKFILIDESLFFDFLGQIYSFLYYIIPKSNGFELSYSIINDNKVKIIFKKYNFENKGNQLSRKRKQSVLFILCDDKFKATKSVKTLEMTKEILFKLSEILGIKIKIMEYDNQNEDKYLTIILPFFIEEKNKQSFLKTDSSKNLPKENKNLNVKNYLNPNFPFFSINKKPTYLTENIEEKNSSEENNISSLNANRKNNLVKEQNKSNNCRNSLKNSFLKKPSIKKAKLSLITNLPKNDALNINTIMNYKKSYTQNEKLKKHSKKNLNENNIIPSKKIVII